MTPHPSLPSDVRPLADLGVGGETPDEHRAASRWDPFWDRDGRYDQTWDWDSRADAAFRRRIGMRTGRARDMRISYLDALERVLASERCLDVLGAIQQWGYLTSQQAAAYGGLASPAITASWREEPRELRLLWSAGLVAAGELVGFGPAAPRAWTCLSDDRIGRRLSVPAAYRVHGGQGWRVARAGVDHGLVAAELGLRLAETGNVATVLGETMSTHRLLLGPGCRGRAACDVTAIDGATGARVAFEVTRSRNRRDIRTKVQRLHKSMTSVDRDDCSVVVCFVDAVDQRTGRGSAANTIADEIREVLRSTPGSAHYRLWDRIYVARWGRDWFPAAGLARPGFARLRAHHFADGRLVADTMPSAPLPVTDRAHLDRVIGSTRFLGGTPAWIRESLIASHGRQDLDDLFRSATGLDSLVGQSQA